MTFHEEDNVIVIISWAILVSISLIPLYIIALTLESVSRIGHLQTLMRIIIIWISIMIILRLVPIGMKTVKYLNSEL
jgi:hypothetical protein